MPDRRQLSEIPSVDEVLRSDGLSELIRIHSRTLVTKAVRYILEEMRQGLIDGQNLDVSIFNIETKVRSYIVEMLKPSLKKVVNASGTILHANLGRAILCDRAIEAIKLAAANPVNIEFNLKEGNRGERDSHVEDIICSLTGAEAATIVNNNAAAVFLVLNTLAEGKEVIISRGELIEIGGSFRIPEIIQKSGCKITEVGTTNRTHLSNYISAINPDTAMLLKVHTSNYKVVSFTSSIALKDLVALGAQHGIPEFEDLGSGSLLDLSQYDLPKEPVVMESVGAGADVVTFSGDKLLGGPQAGIIAGKQRYIQKVNKNPLKRALRVDKLTIAALEATLKLYLNPDAVVKDLPTMRFLLRPVSEIALIADEATKLLKQRLGMDYNIKIEDSETQIGSGSLPEEAIPTKVISVTHKKIAPEKIFEVFLQSEPPILGRVKDEKFLLDMRMIEKAIHILPNNARHSY